MMFRAVLFTLVLAGACAAQPPSTRDRILPPIPRFDAELERRRLIERCDRIVPLFEDTIQQIEDVLRDPRTTPAEAKHYRELLTKMRNVLEGAKARRQELVDEGPQELLPLAPMPREKRTG